MMKTVLLLRAATLALTTTHAAAQDTGRDTGQAAAPANGDIVVTATRVQTLASRTPVSLTAISRQELVAPGRPSTA